MIDAELSALVGVLHQLPRAGPADNDFRIAATATDLGDESAEHGLGVDTSAGHRGHRRAVHSHAQWLATGDADDACRGADRRGKVAIVNDADILAGKAAIQQRSLYAAQAHWCKSAMRPWHQQRRHQQWGGGGGLTGREHAVEQQAIVGHQRAVGGQNDGTAREHLRPPPHRGVELIHERVEIVESGGLRRGGFGRAAFGTGRNAILGGGFASDGLSADGARSAGALIVHAASGKIGTHEQPGGAGDRGLFLV